MAPKAILKVNDFSFGSIFYACSGINVVLISIKIRIFKFVIVEGTRSQVIWPLN